MLSESERMRKRHQHRAMLTFALMLAAAVSFNGTATAQNEDRIIAVRVASEGVRELVLEVTYEYSGRHGEDVFVSAAMAADGETSQYYAVRPDRVANGFGSATVRLGTAQSAPDSFTSDAIEVYFYVGGGRPFLEGSFAYLKTWSKEGAKLPAAPSMLRLVNPPKLVLPQPDDESETTVKRHIQPDGKVELTYPSGTIKLVFQGGMTIINPDGSQQGMLFSSAQPPSPPSAPPDDQHAVWLDFEAERLLGIIRSLVGGDETSVSNYLSKEGDTLSPYEKITMRGVTIGYLLTP